MGEGVEEGRGAMAEAMVVLAEAAVPAVIHRSGRHNSSRSADGVNVNVKGGKSVGRHCFHDHDSICSNRNVKIAQHSPCFGGPQLWCVPFV